MIRTSLRSISLMLLAVMLTGVAIAVAIAYAFQPQSPQSFPLAELPRHTHIHGIAVDREDPSRLFLATHHGFFMVHPDGTAERVSQTRDDFMGFTPHPADPSIFYASGHPATGGNLGFIASEDRGQTWRQLSEGANGPVDFHQMDVSKADPDVIYGVYRGLQVSRDGGHTWRMVGPAPEGLIDLAASAVDPDTLFAATEEGLWASADGGSTWELFGFRGQPVTVIETTEDGHLYAFVVGAGLLRGEEGSPTWETLRADFGDRVAIHLAVDPTDPDRLYLVTQHSEVLASEDAGATWQPFGDAN